LESSPPFENPLVIGHPALREISTPVADGSEIPDNLIRTMNWIAMEDKRKKMNLVPALSAPQLGINKRIIAFWDNQDLCHFDDDPDMPVVTELTDESEWKTYINPIIKGKSEDTISSLEGCLSIPNMAGIVHRPRTIILEAYDYDLEKTVTRKLEGADSLTVQHEIDHLDGILFIDKVDIQNYGDPHYKVYMRNPEGYAGIHKSRNKIHSQVSFALYVTAFIIGYNLNTFITRYRELLEEERMKENRTT